MPVAELAIELGEVGAELVAQDDLAGPNRPLAPTLFPPAGRGSAVGESSGGSAGAPQVLACTVTPLHITHSIGLPRAPDETDTVQDPLHSRLQGYGATHGRDIEIR
jgi:hypothetical protein